MTPTPREVPVWPHEKRNWTGPIKDNPPHCRYCERPWPCPSQRWVDGAMAAVRGVQRMADRFDDGRPNPNGYEGGWNDCRDEIIVILERARATRSRVIATGPAPPRDR
jgi:hypothetical protein